MWRVWLCHVSAHTVAASELRSRHDSLVAKAETLRAGAELKLAAAMDSGFSLRNLAAVMFGERLIQFSGARAGHVEGGCTWEAVRAHGSARTATLGSLWDRSRCCPRRAAVKVKVKLGVRAHGSVCAWECVCMGVCVHGRVCAWEGVCMGG